MIIKTLPDQKLLDDQWYSLNVLLSQPVGTYMRIRNKSSLSAFVFKGEEPVVSNSGTIIEGTRKDGYYLEIPDGSEEVWVKGKGVILSVEIGGDPNPSGLFLGTRAITAQTYIEANVKHGRQFSVAFEISIPSGQTRYAGFTTNTVASGDDTILKTRVINTDGGLRYKPYVGATGVVLGQAIPIFNLNARSSRLSQNSAHIVTSVVDKGVPFDLLRTAAGTGSNRQQGIFESGGIERILNRNDFYLLEFENLDNKEIFVVFTATLYEGILDIYPEI